MLRVKTVLAVLLLAAIAGSVPALAISCDTNTNNTAAGWANIPASNVKFAAVGSSAIWNLAALGAYNANNGISGAVGPLYHYTSSNGFSLIDNRPTVNGGVAVKDTNKQIWIVWDSAQSAGKCAPHVWMYLNVDSVVGDRAFFGSISGSSGVFLQLNAPATGAPAPANAILQSLWGDSSTDRPIPHNATPFGLERLFTNGSGVLINTAATDIDPEDAFFATARVNSAYDTAANTELTGLGFNSANPAGIATDSLTACGGTAGLVNLYGATAPNEIKGDAKLVAPSGYSASSFNIAPFNLYGVDPFTCGSLGTWVTLPVGALPVVVFHSEFTPALTGLTDVSDWEVQQVFSGMLGGSAWVNGGTAANVNPFHSCASCTNAFVAAIREPLSGTYNTFEETIMRHPSSLATYRFSTDLNPVAFTPLPNSPNGSDAAGGFKGRFRVIGSGRMVAAVQNANIAAAANADAMGYVFFSYGNFNFNAGNANAALPQGGNCPATGCLVNVSDNVNYKYDSIDDIDPIFAGYTPGTLQCDPGQPGSTCSTHSSRMSATGNIPGLLSLPTNCQGGPETLPCFENLIWGGAGLSFPNVRNGAYPAWSLVRFVTTTSNQGNVQNLITTAQNFSVTTEPDFVPYNQVVCPAGGTLSGASCPAAGFTDPGLTIIRSHFGCNPGFWASANPNLVGAMCGTNSLTNAPNIASNSPETGRDAGGARLISTDPTTELTQDSPNSIVPFSY